MSLLDEHHETVGGDHRVETALVGGDSSTAITHVLATIDGGVTVEDLLPPGVGDGQQVLVDYVTVSEAGVVETRDDNDFLVSAPSLEGNNSIGV